MSVRVHKPRYSRDVEVAKFWSRVDKSDPDGCWPWTAGRQNGNRGTFRWRGRPVLAYRVAWELAHGEPPPADLFVCHHCDNPTCVRPSHLFVGTCADNNRDMREKGRAKVPHHRGERHHGVTIPDTIVRQCRERYARGGVTAADLARELGASETTVRDWLRGRIRVEAGGPLKAAA